MSEDLRNIAWALRESFGLAGIKPELDRPGDQVAISLPNHLGPEEFAIRNKTRRERAIERALDRYQKGSGFAMGIETPTLLTVKYLSEEIGSRFESLTFSSMLAKQFRTFILLFDMSYGASMQVNCVKLAENELKRSAVQSRDVRDVLHRVAVSREELLQQKSGTLENEENIRSIQIGISRMAAILDKDRSGFELMDEHLRWIKGESTLLSVGPAVTFQEPDFVQAGAKFVLDCYKETFPIASAMIKR